ncbi:MULTISPECIES: TRAP transporter small permease subunit [Marinobacter]|uniref:TRAP transporter small permease subunit n=1 Tax=Marinobacter TaxID=2742 RepID=UPI002943CFBD|nr:TRAP transporter small permease subunit [Marinobacter salarius]WOI19669.1 TRAP transporter small permease subunit [Marinobacter salarius]
MHFISAFNQKLGNYSSLVYLIVFAVTIFDVICRYFWGSPTIWALELIIALAGIHYVLAGAHAIKNNGHVRIDVIYNILPGRVRLCMDLIAYLLMLGFLLIVTYYGYEQAYPAVMTGERSGAGWNSLAPTYMKVAIPIGAGLMALQTLVCLINSIKEIRHEW